MQNLNWLAAERIFGGFAQLNTVKLRRLRLDVLKPHHPNILEFARTLCAEGVDYHVAVYVVEMDDKTETLELIVEGDDIEFEVLVERIKQLGASLHSIDEVAVVSVGSDATT